MPLSLGRKDAWNLARTFMIKRSCRSCIGNVPAATVADREPPRMIALLRLSVVMLFCFCELDNLEDAKEIEAFHEFG